MQLIAGFPLLALLIPSAITRNAILIPAYRDALDAMGLGKTTRCGRAVMLALGMLNPLASSALLTGGITSITAATLIGGFSWLGWFALMAVPYYALLAGGAVALRLLVGRFERSEPLIDPPSARQPFSATEKRTLAVLALTAVLWFTDGVHHLSPAIPALLGGALLLSPGIGVIGWKTFEQRLSWGLILTVGTSLSLADLMTRSGAADWLGNLLLAPLSSLAAAPHALVVGLILAVVSGASGGHQPRRVRRPAAAHQRHDRRQQRPQPGRDGPRAHDHGGRRHPLPGADGLEPDGLRERLLRPRRRPEAGSRPCWR